MPINDDIYQVAVEVMSQALEMNSLELSELEKMVIGVDEPDKVRLNLHNVMVYAYDFRFDGNRDRYLEAVKTTKLLSGHKNFEHFYDEGTVSFPQKGLVEEVYCGWYLTFF